jgi:hypothetical protein
MAPVCFSETVVNVYHIMRRHILDAGRLQQIKLLIFKEQATFLEAESKRVKLSLCLIN